MGGIECLVTVYFVICYPTLLDAVLQRQQSAGLLTTKLQLSQITHNPQRFSPKNGQMNASVDLVQRSPIRASTAENERHVDANYCTI